VEFFIAILLIFLPSGQVGFETMPVATYAECSRLVSEAEKIAKRSNPGAEVRVSCISSETIGQNGA
jgi:hypothetical protein